MKKDDNVKKDKTREKNTLHKGVVTARKCGLCGHHEIAITTDEVEYVFIEPGMVVEIVGKKIKNK
jgi:hypothetical protein